VELGLSGLTIPTQHHGRGQIAIEVYHLIAEMWTQTESVGYLTYKAALTAQDGRFPKALDGCSPSCT
jgi:hypothetical protein